MENAIQASPKAQVERDKLEAVHGRIGFVRRSSDEKAPSREQARGLDVPLVEYDVTIRNARPIVDELSLDKEGFTVIRHKTSWANERDPELFKKQYLEEMASFIKNYFDASWVMSAEVILRSLDGNRAAAADKGLVRTYTAGFAHIDYSPIGSPMIAARNNQVQDLEIRAYSRLMIIQTWRALSPPPQDNPLAFCDISSVLDADIVDTTYSNFGVTRKIRAVYYHPSHRWYYLPEMMPDEFFMFKGYDSEAHYKAGAVHSAFDNRRAYPNAKTRESIEATFYLYYA